MSATMSTDGAARFETANQSLLEVNGPGVALFLMFPVVVSAATLLVPRRLPTVARRVRATAGFLLFAFVLFGAFSIGLFYIPAAGVMMLAAGRVDDESLRTRRPVRAR